MDKVAIVMTKQVQLSYELFEYPPYSLDLAPSESHSVPNFMK